MIASKILDTEPLGDPPAAASGSHMPRFARRALVMAAHLALFGVAFVTALALRFDFASQQMAHGLVRFLPTMLLLKAVVFYLVGHHRGWWRYAGLHDLVLLGKAALLSSGLAFAVLLAQDMVSGWTRSVLLLDLLLTLLLVGGARLALRVFREVLEPRLWRRDRVKVLLVGAGDAGANLLAEMQRQPRLGYEAVGFLDDDPEKLGAQIHKVPVLGAVADLPAIVDEHELREVIIAWPEAPGPRIRAVVEACRLAGVRSRRVPALDDLIAGSATFRQVRDVNIEDLLRRHPVELDVTAIERFLEGRTIVVTGAGGSIGSEICRQVARWRPRTLLLVERYENALFLIAGEMARLFPDVRCVPVIADVGDRRRMHAVFARWRPEAVFHAAAHKHVPLMESNPGEAARNNILGTKVVCDLSDAFGVQAFVLISTDKAVNPSSVMGATKRVAELYVQAMARRSSTRFLAVRFGNVLGSNGSVVPLFQEQIRRGGPLTVTHPEMCRYFMTIPEAAQLVLQAATMGRGGEVFVLDMGEPVRIYDLARDIIKLSGLRPDEDIEIVFTGIRPGEKLFEELTLGSEKAEKTRHPKVWIGCVGGADWASLQEAMSDVQALCDWGNDEGIIAKLESLVPEFTRPDAGVATLTSTGRLTVRRG